MKTCPNCRTGYVHPRSVNYANWHAGQYVVVPHMPAWSCDVCALCLIDPVALQRLLPLIGPVTRSDPTLPRRAAGAQSPVNDLPCDDFDPDRDRRAA
jgi:YgiT-type zinc finger domain-containing protein